MKVGVRLGVAGCDLSPVRVGRLQPLTGVAPRAAPDRAQLEQFLSDLRLPLTANQAMIELVLTETLPEAAHMALRAAHNHSAYVSQLCAEFAELGRLEQDLVHAARADAAVLEWLDEVIAAHRAQVGEDCGETRWEFRSLLPDRVALDAALLCRAVTAVLQVASVRAPRDGCAVEVYYLPGPERGGDGRLVIECTTRGGGFGEVELGYVFAPFRVRDGAGRPLLGLAIGKRLLELHGGDVFVSSPDAGLCRYRIEIAAQPAAHALWIDPLQPGRVFGPVHAGRVLFVGRSERVPARCRGALERAGYHVEQVACEEQVLARIEGDVQRWSAIVLDPTCRQETLFAFVDAVRATGYRALMFLLVEDGTESSRFVAGVDQVLHAPDGSRLLAALRRLRATTNAGTPPVRACPPG